MIISKMTGREVVKRMDTLMTYINIQHIARYYTKGL